jgi:hypothetical protein
MPRSESKSSMSLELRHRSSGIPSYYFKEHDADGRSVDEGPQERLTVEKSESIVPIAVTLSAKPQGKEKNNSEIQRLHGLTSRTLIGGTVVDVNVGRRRSHPNSPVAGVTSAPLARSCTGGGDGWETVYCFGRRANHECEQKRTDIGPDRA